MRLGWILASVVLLALLAGSVHAAADDIADEFAVVNQSDPIEWTKKGVALYNQGKDDDALICFEKALELNSSFMKAWCDKGNALESLGRYDEALDSF